MTRAAKYTLLALFTVTVVSLRLIHLGSDPPSWLSWSTGIYSDEGIYACDARSIFLFHHWAPGNFHSAEITPLHHFLLLIVFRLLGVSLNSVRVISVATSLITLPIFYEAVKAQFDRRTAATATVFLGLSPVVLFYNRLGLLETPTLLLIVIALYFATAKRVGWLSGIALGLAICYKPLALLCLPGLFFDFRTSQTQSKQRLGGLIATLAAYWLVWQLPHAADLSRMNRYYLFTQYLPGSFTQLRYNFVRSCWSGSSDGIFPYIVHHAPLLAALVIWAIYDKKLRTDRHLWGYALWVLVSIAALVVMSKEPSRYFLIFWPAFAVVAAVRTSTLSKTLSSGVVVLFCATSLLVIVPPLVRPTYEVDRAGRLIARIDPSTIIIEGQYAPEFGLCNRLQTVYVQPGLANDKGSVTGRLVLITESPYWSHYWALRCGGMLKRVPAISCDLPHGQIVTIWTLQTRVPSSTVRAN